MAELLLKSVTIKLMCKGSRLFIMYLVIYWGLVIYYYLIIFNINYLLFLKLAKEILDHSYFHVKKSKQEAYLTLIKKR